MESEDGLPTKSTRCRYETALGYLEYDGPSNKISVPFKIRERHLTEDTDTVYLQAVGTHLMLTIESDRDNICIKVPLKKWRQTRPYKQTFTGENNGLISVGKFEDYLDTVPVPDDAEESYGIVAIVQKIDGRGELDIAGV